MMTVNNWMSGKQWNLWSDAAFSLPEVPKEVDNDKSNATY